MHTFVQPAGKKPELQKKCSCGGTCSKCRHAHSNHDDHSSQTHQSGYQQKAPQSGHDVLNPKGHLPGKITGQFMESKFNHDFSYTKLHTGSIADQLASERNASVYMMRNHGISGFAPFSLKPGNDQQSGEPFNEFQKPGGTDDLTQTDLTVPRADGDAATPSPTRDGGASGATTAGSCCDQAFANGLAASDYGGVICCNNVKHSCIWPSNMSSALTNARARSISIDCARVHEDTHHDDIDCTGAAIERPNFKAGKNARAEECIAYRAEVACFDAHLADCGGVAECESQIRARRTVKQGQADANCA